MPHLDLFLEEGAAGPEELGIHGLRRMAAGKPEEGLKVMTGRGLFAERRFARTTGDVGGSDVPGAVTEMRREFLLLGRNGPSQECREFAHGRSPCLRGDSGRGDPTPPGGR